MPCEGNTKVFVKLSNGMETKSPMKAKQWLWDICSAGSVVGWRYAETTIFHSPIP